MYKTNKRILHVSSDVQSAGITKPFNLSGSNHVTGRFTHRAPAALVAIAFVTRRKQSQFSEKCSRPKVEMCSFDVRGKRDTGRAPETSFAFENDEY